jgi:hypothetical protein
MSADAPGVLSPRELLHDINNALSISDGQLRMLLKEAQGLKALSLEERLEKIEKAIKGIERSVLSCRQLRDFLMKDG